MATIGDLTTSTARWPDLVPARMLNEFAYCPRLAYLEWVQGEFADNLDTVEGRLQHRRTDQVTGNLPEPADDGDGETELLHTRSVLLSDEDLGAIARIDLIEGEGRSVIPIDYKHGRMPDVPGGAWEPERVQLCLQGLLLRANGYECTKGALYFVESKRRVEVPFDDALASRTLSLLSEIRQVAGSGQIPPPLVDSPKCPRCSLVGICLPDETNLLAVTGGRNSLDKNAIRRLIPARDDALPVYVQAQGATVGKSGDTLQIKVAGAVVQKVRLLEVSHVAIFGNVQITSQALRELCDRNIPVCHFTYGGWFQGITTGMAHKNVELRTCQFSGSATPEVFLPIAREFVHGKIKNSRTLLRRNHREVPPATTGRAQHAWPPSLSKLVGSTNYWG